MPYTTKIGHAHLKVRGLDRSLDFYLQSHYPGANLFS
jgi:catechol-2,3-dioxygenase